MSILLEDLDLIILADCDLEDDLFNIVMVNHYYYDLIHKNKLFLEGKKAHADSKVHIKNINRKFQLACYHDCMLYAKYLLSKHSKINIYADNECAFRWSCSNGKLDVAKWLIELSGQEKYQKININELRMRLGDRKRYNPRDTANFRIYSLNKKINIHADNDFAFKKSRDHGFTEITNWLIDLSNQPGYKPFDHKLLLNN